MSIDAAQGLYGIQLSVQVFKSINETFRNTAKGKILRKKLRDES